MSTDQPRVISITEPPVVTSILAVSTSPNLPTLSPAAVQATRTIPSGRLVTGMGTEGWTEVSSVRDNLSMDFTDTLELHEDDPLQTDRYVGAYPDFHMPLDGHPRISEVFYANTLLMSNDNFPLTLIFMPEWERENYTAMFGVDQGNGIVCHLQGRGENNKQVRLGK